ncbi:MAG: ShlB/FhaC/HecB family hemolysin secretion/activation protein, partial [Gloeomargaritaceae cyanobacterium C42_A2020_066]|nr:ShlB/FhaC/HecB family hemolysin secretion/activation protein [Gloeomargaritaceae cyanobacterium C42_A2020_066]
MAVAVEWKGLSLVGSLFLFGWAVPAFAQNPQLTTPDPNQERLLQPPRRPAPIPAPVPLTPSRPAVQPTSAPDADRTLQVSRIEVTGSTVLGPDQLDPIIQPLENQTVTLGQLLAAADAITQLYVDRGFITSRAVLAEQQVAGGVVQIQVIEGRLQEIQIEGNRRLNTEYLRSRVNLGVSVPLNPAKLEEQLRLLKTNPLLENVEASLRPGEGPGESILVVQVVEDPQPFKLSFSLDNYVPPSVAAQRASLAVGYENLSGLGDEISAAYSVGLNFSDWEQAALNVYDFSYRVPLNPMEGTLQFRAALTNNQITDPDFAALNVSGESQLYALSFRQPLLRTVREEFALSGGFTWQQGQTFLDGTGIPFGFGPDEDGFSTTSVFSFGQDYIRRDTSGAWVVISQLNLGLGILGATVNESPVPDGNFLSWQAQAQRIQSFGNDYLLIMQGYLQLSTDGLLPQQQFVIG